MCEGESDGELVQRLTVVIRENTGILEDGVLDFA